VALLSFRKILMLVGVILGTALCLAGCTTEGPTAASPNVPPETAPLRARHGTDEASWLVHLEWGGMDPDGAVSGYLTRLDDSPWVSVSLPETLLVYPRSAEASVASDEPVHLFCVKAVDDRGAEDPTPSEIAFTYRNVLPETEIVGAPPSVAGPMVTFDWDGFDPDGVLIGYGYRLLSREGDEWLEVVSVDSLGADDTSETFGPIAGIYRFEVWSIDDEGGVDPTPAARVFTCFPWLANPRLRVDTNFMGTHEFLGPVWSDVYNIPTPIFEGERVWFRWEATAEDYGGQIVGYRHAFDDTSAWPAWSLDDTRFEVIPEVGRHSLYVHVLDNANVLTRARIRIDVVEASLDEYILVVDDWDWSEDQPSWGTDEDRTAFYDEILAGYVHYRVEWEPLHHAEHGRPQPPGVDALRGASTVIWYVDHENTVLSDLFECSLVPYDALSGYLRVGGNLILCGQEALTQIVDQPYPLCLAAADTTRGASFVRDYLRVGCADNSGYGANPNAPGRYGYCFYGAVPSATSVPEGRDGLWEPMYIDSLGKWSVIYNNANPNYRRGGLPGIESLTPWAGTGIDGQLIDSHLNMNFDGVTCTVVSPSGSHHGNVCYFGFPLYYLQTPQVDAVLDALLQLFGEEML
jgi:hypothetical protein